MKKILFGSAAICTVVGFSSFKKDGDVATLYYFFKTNDARVSVSPSVGVSFNNANLIANPYLGNETLNTISTETTSGCPGGSHWYAAVFTANQVIPTSYCQLLFKKIKALSLLTSNHNNMSHPFIKIIL